MKDDSDQDASPVWLCHGGQPIGPFRGDQVAFALSEGSPQIENMLVSKDLRDWLPVRNSPLWPDHRCRESEIADTLFLPPSSGQLRGWLPIAFGAYLSSVLPALALLNVIRVFVAPPTWVAGSRFEEFMMAAVEGLRVADMLLAMAGAGVGMLLLRSHRSAVVAATAVVVVHWLRLFGAAILLRGAEWAAPDEQVLASVRHAEGPTMAFTRVFAFFNVVCVLFEIVGLVLLWLRRDECLPSDPNTASKEVSKNVV